MSDMRPITSEGELIREFSQRARAAGLKVDCLSGGPMSATVAVVSEAPGERETAMRVPFVGGSGQKLWSVLSRIGLTRTNTFVTNAVKRQVSLSSKTDERDPVGSLELEHWAGLLQWELSQLPNLKYVFVLGNMALKALLGEEGITNWRGSVNNIRLPNGRDITCVMSYNPAMLLREPKLEIIFRFDVDKLERVITGRFVPHVISPIIDPSPSEAIEWIDKMQDEKLPVSLDIETIANETACVGLGNDVHTGMCINFRDRSKNRFNLHEEREVRKRINQFTTDETTKIVAQNGAFDSYWLWYKDRIRIHAIWFDTLLAHHTLYPRLPHNLGFLTAQYTTHPYYKDDKKAWKEGGNISTFWDYNVRDVCITLKCQQALMKELTQQKLDKFYFDHVAKLQPELVLMTCGGVKIDTTLKKQIAEELQVDLEIHLKAFHDAVAKCTGDPEYKPNPKSPKQMSALFFNRLGLVGRGTSTNEENRKRMALHHRTSEDAKVMLGLLDKYVEEQKFSSTYAEMSIDEDGRVRCEYKQYGTQSAPGRLSSTKTLWGTGMNLQNQPQRAYKMYIADEGHEFSYFDLSQAEARIVAFQWKVEGLKDSFRRAAEDHSFDIHRGNASKIFRCAYEDVPSFDRYELGKTTDDPALADKITKRFLGKRCVHGLNYRMLAQRLADVCQIPLWQAEEARSSYFKAFPEIPQAWEKIIAEVRQNHCLFNLMGRRLLYLEPLTEEALESVVAYVPQSTIGDKVSRVIYRCHNDPDWPRTRSGKLMARVALNIHDALISINRLSDGDAVRAIMKKHAEEPIIIHGEPVVIPAELKKSVPDEHGVHRWSNLKKVV